MVGFGHLDLAAFSGRLRRRSRCQRLPTKLPNLRLPISSYFQLFGIAFAEASGPRLVRSDGNDDGLRRQAESNILRIAAGRTFLILFREAYPINVINKVRNVSEVATIYCATSNPVQMIVAKAETSRSVIGIVDGLSSRAIESEDDKQNRSKLLRDLGYKK